MTISATPATHAGHTTLRQGDAGGEVKTLQDMLNRIYGYAVEVDGIFGEKTERAVRRFQIDCQLAADGIVGTQTWEWLHRVVGATGKDHPFLRRGDRGEWVEYLQVRLNTHLSPELAVDGQFGDKTEATVKQFQGDYRLTVDGIVGTQTWRTLEGLLG